MIDGLDIGLEIWYNGGMSKSMKTGTTFHRDGDLATHTILGQDATHYLVRRESWGLAGSYRYRLRKP